ncbi:MAG: family ATPase, partial [Candidatus Saccharibacteria bacterium]|nr:family ATPase [Candidatus Saccharibacteria bacterium]
RHLGGIGVKQVTCETDHADKESDHAWYEEHGIEKFRPEKLITLRDVGGLEREKKILADIAISFKHPELLKKWGARRPQGVLLYGESGTGKTMLAQALAHATGAEMWLLQSTDIYNKWLGESEQRIKEIFNRMRQTETPLIVFFDEFDSIVSIGSDSTRNAVAGIFKQEMNTLAEQNPNVLIVAATNNLGGIDPSLIRSGRFDHQIYIPMPDQAGRQQIAINIISKITSDNETETTIFSNDLDTREIASRTDGLSGADLAEIFRRLSLSKAIEEARTGQEQAPITQADIVQEIQNFRQNG